MFSKILGKKKEGESEQTKEHLEIINKVSKMNLTEMRSFVNNNGPIPLSEEGLIAVLDKLITPHPQTNTLYIQQDDMDTKKRKAFELVLLISKSQRITFEAVDRLQKFLETYMTLITSYDKEHKEIYASRLSDAVEISLKNINKMSNLKAKMDILGQND